MGSGAVPRGQAHAAGWGQSCEAGAARYPRLPVMWTCLGREKRLPSLGVVASKSSTPCPQGCCYQPGRRRAHSHSRFGTEVPTIRPFHQLQEVGPTPVVVVQTRMTKLQARGLQEPAQQPSSLVLSHGAWCALPCPLAPCSAPAQAAPPSVHLQRPPKGPASVIGFISEILSDESRGHHADLSFLWGGMRLLQCNKIHTPKSHRCHHLKEHSSVAVQWQFSGSLVAVWWQ